jgi:hypothetical protein
MVQSLRFTAQIPTICKMLLQSLCNYAGGYGSVCGITNESYPHGFIRFVILIPIFQELLLFEFFALTNS